jgi:hypothetical protein
MKQNYSNAVFYANFVSITWCKKWLDWNLWKTDIKRFGFFNPKKKCTNQIFNYSLNIESKTKNYKMHPFVGVYYGAISETLSAQYEWK